MTAATAALIQGLCPPQFQAVRDQFERYFYNGEDLGAARFLLNPYCLGSPSRLTDRWLSI